MGKETSINSFFKKKKKEKKLGSWSANKKGRKHKQQIHKNKLLMM